MENGKYLFYFNLYINRINTLEILGIMTECMVTVKLIMEKEPLLRGIIFFVYYEYIKTYSKFYKIRYFLNDELVE
jgi:hypothetical protein